MSATDNEPPAINAPGAAPSWLDAIDPSRQQPDVNDGLEAGRARAGNSWLAAMNSTKPAYQMDIPHAVQKTAGFKAASDSGNALNAQLRQQQQLKLKGLA